MCEILLAIWPAERRVGPILGLAARMERFGVAGFGWGIVWRDGAGLHRYRRALSLCRDVQAVASLEHTRASAVLIQLPRPHCTFTSRLG